MARKRVKRDDILEHIVPDDPFTARLSHDGPVHIVIEKAQWTDLKDGRKDYHYYFVTKCKRVTEWPDRTVRIFGESLCSRCGTYADFEQVADDVKVRKIEWERERRQKSDMEDAERVANNSWSWLGEQIESQITNELHQVVNSGQILVPLSKDEIKRLRTLVYRDIQQTFGGVTDVGLPRLTKILYEKLRDYDE